MRIVEKREIIKKNINKLKLINLKNIEIAKQIFNYKGFQTYRIKFFEKILLNHIRQI